MTKELKEEIEKLIKELEMGSISIEEFRDSCNTDWGYISQHKKLSEEFIREFKSKLHWLDISDYQKLSGEFIIEMKEHVYWSSICFYQTLSEAVIKEMKKYVVWQYVSCYQKLSEEFLREMGDYVNWGFVPIYQKISEEFLREMFLLHQEIQEIDIIRHKEVNREITLEEKEKEMREYADKMNLKFDGEYLYAFRNHDKEGRGVMGSTYYEKGKYYRDWHLDMRKDVKNSFGLGIWPCGNTPVRVKVEDWGLYVSRDDGKCRVWGFEVL